jgi:hypothetical protein
VPAPPPTGSPIVDLDIRRFSADRNIDLEEFGGVRLRLSIRNSGTVAATGSAVIVGRQGGAIVFSRTIAVARRVGDGSARYVVRVSNMDLFRPGLVTWTVSLIVTGDPDEPAGDVASATTMIVGEHDSDESDEPEGFRRER